MPRKKIERQNNNLVEKKSQDKVFYLEFLTPAQKLAWTIYQQHDVLFLTGAAGTGKAQPLDAKICTPSGWIKMGDITVNSVVSTPNGKQARVSAVFPQGEKDVYRVIFHDGSSAECCLDHLWKVSSISNGWKDKVVDTDYIIKNVKTSNGRRKLWIEVTKPVFYSYRMFDIDPYLMGQLISEGGLTGPNVCVSVTEGKVREKLVEVVNNDYCWKESSNGSTLRLVKKKKSNKANIYRDFLRNVGLWGSYSYEKFIPIEYLHSGIEQRIALLQGMMDGEGTVNRHSGQAIYTTTSAKLADDLVLLVNSLGGIATVSIKEKPFYRKNGVPVVCRVAYNVCLNLPVDIVPFSLPRKLELYHHNEKYKPRRYIERVEYVGKDRCQCIMLDDEDHLYLTDDYIVTHNSYLAVAFALQELFGGSKKNIVFTRPIVEAGESLGFLPGTLEEKVDPYMTPLMDCLTKMTGRPGGASRVYVEERLEIAPLAYLRGRTFTDSVCILDEAQNCSMAQLTLFLTRLGNGSKMVITGDPDQSDLFSTSKTPLAEMITLLSCVTGIGVVEFPEKYIVRHPLVGKILRKLKEARTAC